jgi:uncharacterized protein YdeI (YjbR/CyaY-like superfamily)
MDQDVYFPTVADLRKWFEANHDKHDVAWFGFYKVGTGVPSITYKDAVDECLCFGWIDGVRYGIDEQRWRERFTPRRAGSFWSSVNTKRALELIEAGRMTPAGLAAFELRDQSRTKRLDDERATAAFSPEEEAQFRANSAAWAYFEAAPPSYRKPATHYVASAKRPETRQKRLETLIADSAANRRLRQLTSPSNRVE